MNLYGTWHLVATVGTDDQGQPSHRPFGSEPFGVLCFTPNDRMICAVCNNAVDLSEEDSPREYASYGGPFTFDGTTLVTTVDLAADPARLGTQQVRKVRFDGKRLTLTPPARTFKGGVQHRDLIWERVSAAA
jgi:hypothetical protein